MFANTATALQNGTRYEIVLGLPDGTRLKWLDRVGPFSYTRVANNFGRFSMTLPEAFDRTLLAYDNRITIYRQPAGGVPAIDFVGLIRVRDTMMDSNNNLLRVISGPSLEYLLDGRMIAYVSGSAEADQTDQGDDMIKVIARQNLGSSASTARQISSSYFSVGPDNAGGPTITKAFSYRNVLATMRDIADACRAAGTEVWFAIVPQSEAAFQLQTFIGQPGINRTTAPYNGPIFGPTFGNMMKARLVENGMDEVNFVYGLGQGQGSNRNIQTAEDTARSLRDILARREGSINANMETSNNGVTAAAYTGLNAGRPVPAFSAQLISKPGSLYGLDWGFGDRLPISFDGRQFPAVVRAVTIEVDAKGREALAQTALEAYNLV